MCNVKPLNPQAKEWRPKPSQQNSSSQLLILPHQIHNRHQTPTAVVPPPHAAVLCTAPPQQSPFSVLIVPCYKGFVPYGDHSRFNEHVPEEKKVETFHSVESPKSLSVDDSVHRKFGYKRVFPHRLKRVVSAQAKPAGVKIERTVVTKMKPCLDEEKTTVMVKNIPNKLRRDFMLKFLDEKSIEQSLEYDFLYLPMDFWTEDNLGYAFVNFTTAKAACKFKKIMQNFKWINVNTDKCLITSKKTCEITWAKVQGKEALMKRFENSSFPCNNLDFLPVLLDPPRNGSNPNPNPPLVLGKLSRSA